MGESLMAKVFEVSVPPASANLKVRAKQKTEVTFTVSNLSSRQIRGRVMLKPDDPAVKNKWVTVAQEPEKDFGASSTFQFTVTMNVPADAPPGKYTFRLDAVNADVPDEGDSGPTVGFEIVGAPPPSFPKWIIPVAAVVLLLVIGLVAWLILSKKNPAPTPTPEPTPTGQPTPVPAPQSATILGVGTDRNLWTRKTLDSQWVQVPNSGLVTAVTVMRDGTIVGIGLDRLLYTRANLNSPWVQVANSGLVTAVTVMRDGTIVGIGLDRFLWTRATLFSPWVQVPNSGLVTGIAVMRDGTIVGIGTDALMYTRATLYSPWVQVPNSGSVIAIASMTR